MFGSDYLIVGERMTAAATAGGIRDIDPQGAFKLDVNVTY